jgi:hypothetical protein
MSLCVPGPVLPVTPRKGANASVVISTKTATTKKTLT